MGTDTDNNQLKASAEEAAVDAVAARLAAIAMKTAMATATTMRTKAATATVTACYENKVLWYLHTVLTYQSHVTPIVTHHGYL